MRLLDGAGGLLAGMTVRTGAPYSFTGLQPGCYQIEVAGTGAAGHAGSRSVPFILASGGTVTSRAASIDTPGTVIGSAVLAGDGFGTEGATVRLLSAAGTKVATTTAGPGGAYSFAGIAPGRYRVEVCAPAGSGREGSATSRTALFEVTETGPTVRPTTPGRKRMIGAMEEEFLLAVTGHARWPAGTAQPSMIRRSAGAIRPVAEAPTISP